MHRRCHWTIPQATSTLKRLVAVSWNAALGHVLDGDYPVWHSSGMPYWLRNATSHNAAHFE